MLINTPKGQQLFDNSKDAFTYQQHRLDEVLPGNPALLKIRLAVKNRSSFSRFSNLIHLAIV